AVSHSWRGDRVGADESRSEHRGLRDGVSAGRRHLRCRRASAVDHIQPARAPRMGFARTHPGGSDGGHRGPRVPDGTASRQCWSRPAWAAIVTGHSPDENRVHADLAATAPGLPVFEVPLEFNAALNPMFAVEAALAATGIVEPIPTPRSQLTWPPVWERLSRA